MRISQQPGAGQDGGACIHRRILARILAALPAASRPRRIEETFVSAEALDSERSSMPSFDITCLCGGNLRRNSSQNGVLITYLSHSSAFVQFISLQGFL